MFLRLGVGQYLSEIRYSATCSLVLDVPASPKTNTCVCSYGQPWAQGDRLGVHLDTWRGTVEFYLNRFLFVLQCTGYLEDSLAQETSRPGLPGGT